MRERAAELGGEFVVEKRPLGGITVRARLPILETVTSPATMPEQDPELHIKEE
jgi:signal transduction histidine kinase